MVKHLYECVVVPDATRRGRGRHSLETKEVPACSTRSTLGIPAALTEEAVRAIVQEELERAPKRDPAGKKAAFIASKGTLDWAYPPLILATTAAASGMDASIFFTFYGLNIIHKDFEQMLKVSPLGNPAMPMPVPMPNLVLGLPGMGPMATQMMKAKFARQERRARSASCSSRLRTSASG